MSHNKSLNSPPIPTSAHLLLSSVTSTKLKSFNLILMLCPAKWPPPPPPAAHFSPLQPWSLAQFTVPGHSKNFITRGKLPSKNLPPVFDGSPADHSRTEFWWRRIFSNILDWGWCSDSCNLFFFFPPTNPNPNTSGQHQLQKILLFYIPKQSEIGLLRARNAQTH